MNSEKSGKPLNSTVKTSNTMRFFVEIKKPCHETLEAKKPGEKGNYCKSCQTLVIDFTGMTPEEIAAYFSDGKNQSVCGTYNRTDVKTDDAFYNFISLLHAKKMKFLALLIVGILVLTGCKSRKNISYTAQGSRILDEHKPSIENLK